jgi:hypothetical protein
MGDEIFNPANHTRASDEAWAGVHKRKYLTLLDSPKPSNN